MVVPKPDEYDVATTAGRAFVSTWLFAQGGAIAYFGETVTLPNDMGRDLETYMLDRWVAGDRVLGDLYRMAQRKYWIKNNTNGDQFRAPRIYLGIMTMFGDPSLRLEP